MVSKYAGGYLQPAFCVRPFVRLMPVEGRAFSGLEANEWVSLKELTNMSLYGSTLGAIPGARIGGQNQMLNQSSIVYEDISRSLSSYPVE